MVGTSNESDPEIPIDFTAKKLDKIIDHLQMREIFGFTRNVCSIQDDVA